MIVYVLGLDAIDNIVNLPMGNQLNGSQLWSEKLLDSSKFDYNNSQGGGIVYLYNTFVTELHGTLFL